MKKDEFESLIKSFLLFFISIELLMSIIAYFYYEQQVSYTEDAIFLEMKNFNYTLKGDKFKVDILTKTPAMQTLLLLKNSKEIYAYFPIPQVDDTLLKIIYPIKDYNVFRKTLQWQFAIAFSIITLLVVLFSLSFAFYTLGPLRKSLQLLEEFLKDIIHDLNTPVTAILVNSKLLRKNFKEERLDRIDLSAKTIVSLHKNLEMFLRKMPMKYSKVDLNILLEERCAYFKSIFPALKITLKAQTVTLETSEDAIQRIIDNILSNACKYNRPDGYINVTLDDKSITIEDGGYGIKDTKKIFERFYKEGDRGLGIGLHIVKKLCDELNITIEVTSSGNGSTFTLSWR